MIKKKDITRREFNKVMGRGISSPIDIVKLTTGSSMTWKTTLMNCVIFITSLLI